MFTTFHRRGRWARFGGAVILLVSLWVPAAASAQRETVDGPTIRWTARYDPGGGDDWEAQRVAATPDGSLALVSGLGLAGNSGFATVAYEAASGSVRWR